MSLPVKNVSRAAQVVEGCGALAPGETGKAADSEHTKALIDAGHLLPLTETAKTVEKRPPGKGEKE